MVEIDHHTFNMEPLPIEGLIVQLANYIVYMYPYTSPMLIFGFGGEYIIYVQSKPHKPVTLEERQKWRFKWCDGLCNVFWSY